MKQLTRFVAITIMCTISTTPAIAMAQTSTSTSATSSSSVVNDGASDSGSTRRDRVRGYRGQSSEVQQKIAALPSMAVQSVLMPVLFGVAISNISPNFGDPRSGGRTHEGEDIMAVKGTPIVSPTQAVVLRTGVGPTEGNYVYTANPGGETFVYMHLDKIGEGVVSGAPLSQGSLIGYVGNTGNASGGAAHLHFEIHDNTGAAVDPFPRLKVEFSIQEKITYLTAILAQTSDAAALAQLLASNFRSTLTTAAAANIPMPLILTNALASSPSSPSAPVATTPIRSLPEGDLEIGSSGAVVVALQQHLIQAASGNAAARLGAAGATGYFGAITLSALVEYQIANNVMPANGYFGPSTRIVVTAKTGVTPITPTTATPPAPTSGTNVSLTRNLFRGVNGEDVRELQKYLNTHGYVVALSGSGSVGNETAYFGAATEAAVIKFQTARSISPAVGYVGSLTRAALALNP